MKKKAKKKVSRKNRSRKKFSLRGKTVKKSKPKKAAKKIEKPIGRVTHFFSGIKVMIVKFKKPVRAGIAIHVKGATTDFKQKIVSMQFDHEPIQIAKKNASVGIKVSKRVREGDSIYPVK